MERQISEILLQQSKNLCPIQSTPSKIKPNKQTTISIIVANFKDQGVNGGNLIEKLCKMPDSVTALAFESGDKTTA